MTMDLTTILGLVAGVFFFVLSWLYKNERQVRKDAENERDQAEHRLKEVKNDVSEIVNIIKNQQRLDNEISNDDGSDRTGGLGVWHNEIRNGNTNMRTSNKADTSEGAGK